MFAEYSPQDVSGTEKIYEETPGKRERILRQSFDTTFVLVF